MSGQQPPGVPVRAPACGFTLIELIIVCVILGILLPSSVPRLQPTAQRLRMEQAAFDVAQWLRVARECAVSECRECTWTWEEEARRMRISRGPGGRGGSEELDIGSPTAGRLPAESPTLPEGAAIQVTRAGEPVACRCIRFFPDGTGEAAILSVEGAARVFTVTVDEATGRVLVAAGPVAG